MYPTEKAKVALDSGSPSQEARTKDRLLVDNRRGCVSEQRIPNLEPWLAEDSNMFSPNRLGTATQLCLPDRNEREPFIMLGFCFPTKGVDRGTEVEENRKERKVCSLLGVQDGADTVASLTFGVRLF
jgi:hypothetical protein